MLDELMQTVNLRDIGGVRTADGRMVQRGIVYRSAALTDLADARLAAARALGIRTIIDLRRNGERNAYPTPWEMMGSTDYWTRDHDYSDADHLARMRHPDFTAEDGRVAMLSLYRDLPYVQSEAYAYLFRTIAEGRGPVLFHCAAGKDRTGVAAALVLWAVGVPQEAIFEDYRLTTRADLSGLPHRRARRGLSAEQAVKFAPLFESDPDYLAAMFDAMDQRGVTIRAYLRNTLGLTDAECAALRDRLLEPAT
jgi:protein-tyrosine phosphatase